MGAFRIDNIEFRKKAISDKEGQLYINKSSVDTSANTVSDEGETNIATVITAWGANLINSLDFTGIPLLILVVIIFAFINLFNNLNLLLRPIYSVTFCRTFFLLYVAVSKLSI